MVSFNSLAQCLLRYPDFLGYVGLGISGSLNLPGYPVPDAIA
jgi:hypothetical protein